MKNFLQLIFLIAAIPVLAQPPVQKPVQPKPKKAMPPMNDFAVSLHEETMNKVFDALGEITGTNEYSVMLIKGKYHWTVVNPRINLKPDSSDFTCDAKVVVGPFDYKTPVKGRVKIWFDNEKNLINVKITTAIFELYTKVLGKKIHIKDIELADYFPEPFQFEGPKSFATDFSFMTPDSVLKRVFMKPCDCDMTVKWKEIVTMCEMAVSNQPFPVPAPVTTQADPTKAIPPDDKNKPANGTKK